MCVAIYKPAGIACPSIETLKQCWDANPDGAGIAWRTADAENPLHIEKGFMNWKEFETYWKAEQISSYTGDLFIHFRITTHGGTSEGNTHPFPIVDSDIALKAMSCDCRNVLMHNGILPVVPDSKDISDTMMLCKLIARGRFEERPQELMNLVNDIIGTNKLIMMDKHGVYMAGQWQEIDGVYYSNTLWQYRYDYYNGAYSTTASRKSGMYDTCDDTSSATYADYIDMYLPDASELKDLRNGICPWCQQSSVLDEYEDCWLCNDCNIIFEKKKGGK